MRSRCGQFSDDRRECVGYVGAEADLPPVAAGFLGHGRRVIRKDRPASPRGAAQPGPYQEMP